MVAIVAGNSLGLSLTSLTTLGSAGVIGSSGAGRNGQQAYVNVSNGNLVLQTMDEQLMSRGNDIQSLRTYNSQGLLNDDNGDNWGVGLYTSTLALTGTLNQSGSFLTRTQKDGSACIYAYTGSNTYSYTRPDGLVDNIVYGGFPAKLTWTDSANGNTESYEATGSRRLTASKDAFNNTLTYSYDSNNQLISIANSNGEVEYYDRSTTVPTQLTGIRTYSGGQYQTAVYYTYDSSNRLITVKLDLSPEISGISDGNVYTTNYTYDGSSNRVASITQNDGVNLSFTYVQTSPSEYRVASVIDAVGRTTTYTYDLVVRRTSVQDPLGQVTTYAYDAAGRLTSIYTPQSSSTAQAQYTYNAAGEVQTIVDADGRVTTFLYDAANRLTLKEDQAGNTLTRTYDSLNQVTSETVYTTADPDGISGGGQPAAPLTTRYIYDGRLLKYVLSPEGRVKAYLYDSYGNNTSAIEYGASTYDLSSYSINTAPTSSMLQSWASSQDLTRTTRMDMTYDLRSQLSQVTKWNSIGSSGTGVNDGLQSITQYTYDGGGRLRSTISPVSGTTNFIYDGLDRVVSSTDALSNTTQYQYTDFTNTTRITSANGLITTSTYTASGELATVATSGTGITTSTTTYYYDADDQLRMVKDPTGARKWMLYDSSGRKTADIDADGTLIEYSYNRNGLVTVTTKYATRVNTASLMNGTLPNLSVSLNSVRPAANSADVKSWNAYDDAQRLVKTVDSQGAVTEFVYDGAARLLKTIRYAAVIAVPSTSTPTPGSIAPASSSDDRVKRNLYDQDGLLRGLLDEEGYLTEYRYDAEARLTETVKYATASASGYRASGNLTQLIPSSDPRDIHTWRFYNAKNQIIAQVDGEGFMVEYVYDKNGNTTQEIAYSTKVSATISASSSVSSLRPSSSSADRTTSRVFDKLNRLTQVTDPQGTITNNTFDSVGNLTSAVAGAGTDGARTLNTKYDLLGRVTAELSANGAALLVAGQTQAQINAIWAQYGVTYVYDAASRRMSSTDAMGNRTLFFYNADGLLTHTINALGEVHENVYNGLNQLTSTKTYATRLAASTISALTGNLAGGLVNTTLTNGIVSSASDTVTTYTYGAMGKVTGIAAPLASTTSIAYNIFGDEISRSVAIDATHALNTSFTVDHRGLRTATTDDSIVGGLNAVTAATYDAFGRMIRSTDALGHVTNFAYDKRGRLVMTVDPTNATRTTTYDAFDRVLSQTDALNHTTTYAYDKSARTMTVTTPEGIATVTTYSRLGQVQSLTDGKGQITSYAYDRDGNLMQAVTSLTTTNSKYDAADRLIETTDANGNKVAYTYDAANRVLTRSVDPSGLNLTTTYAWDAKGQQISVTDANGVVTQTQYDLKGQTISQTVDPAGLALQTIYTYDARGKVLSITSPGGTVTQYVYDALGRRTSEITDAGSGKLNLTRSYAYDKNSNVTSVTDANLNVTRYAYDADDRLVFTLDALGDLQKNFYDLEGRIVKTIAYAAPISLSGLGPTVLTGDIEPRIAASTAAIPNDAVEYRVYDNDNRLTSTVDGTGGVVKFTYDTNGNVVDRISYASRITLSSWTPGTTPAPATDSAHDEHVRTVYDALNRAVYSVSGVGGVTENTWDGNGNLIQSKTYAALIPTTTAATTSAISAATALVADASHDQVLRTVYDAANRATRSIDGVGAVVATTYDNVGRVVRRTAYATAISPSTAATKSAIDTAVAAIADPTKDQDAQQVFDAAGRLIRSVNGIGAVTQWTYDNNGNALTRRQYATPLTTNQAVNASIANTGADRVTSWTYDTANRATFEVNALNAVTQTVYDANGNVVQRIARANPIGDGASPSTVSIDNANDRVSRFGYDQAGRMVLSIDAQGSVTERQFDGANRLTASIAYASPVDSSGLALGANLAAMRVITNPAANTANDRKTMHAWDAASHEIYTVDPTQAVVKTLYDGAGRVTQSVAYGLVIPATTANTADAISAAIVASPTRDQSTSYAWDAAGNLLSTTDALSNTESYTWDALGDKISFTNKKNFVWTYAYDAAGRMTSETSPQVALTTVAANGAGNLVETSTANATIVTLMAYDALGNLTQRTEAAGRTGEERITQYRYDALGRQIRTIYPPVAVYDPLTDSPTTNGASGLASRVETAATSLEVWTFYNIFGDAVASRDVAGAVSQKAYNQAGQVVYEIDAMGYVTGYSRNLFGDVLVQKRYSAATSLANINLTNASQAASRAGIEAALVTSDKDRTLTSSYDRMGRATEVKEMAGYTYDSSAAAGSQISTTIGKTTQTIYDAFGEAVQVKTLRSAGVWDSTFHYFDKMGRETATVDALKYISTRGYDALGNLSTLIEYSTALTGTPTAQSFGTITNSPLLDRRTNYAWDKLNRKVSETRLQVEVSDSPAAASARADLTTSYGYDAVSNLTRTTDAAGNSTYTYYDALGRITAVAAPGLNAATHGSSPVTEFRRDAYGNVVVKIDHAVALTMATEAASGTITANAADRSTFSLFDKFGHTIQTTDALSHSAYMSWDATGHLAKSWQSVTGTDGLVHTEFEIYQYDKLGQLTHSITPASTAVLQGGSVNILTQSQVGTVDQASQYNAFGEVTSRGSGGGALQEYFDYDNAGRLWRTNNGDGVDRVMLYDAEGNETAEIRSNGFGNLKAMSDVSTVVASTETRRVDMLYDSLGRVTETRNAVRQEQQDGVSVHQIAVSSNISAYQIYHSDENTDPIPWWEGNNVVDLNWSSLANLGSGDVKVVLDYKSADVYHPEYYDENSGITWPAYTTLGTAHSQTRILTSKDALTGAQISWQDTTSTTPIPSSVTHVSVYKKDVNGVWQQVIDSTGTGAPSNVIDVAAPANPKTSLTLEMSSDGTNWFTAGPLTNFGDAFRFDARGLAAGTYQYRVKVTESGTTSPRTVATGSLALSAPPLGVITGGMAFGVPGTGTMTLSWPSLGAGYGQVFNYRVAGSGGAWSTMSILTGVGGTSRDGISVIGLANGNYEFELLAYPNGQAMPSAHATGTFSYSPAHGPIYVPQQGYPQINGFTNSDWISGSGTSGDPFVVDTGIQWGGFTSPYDFSSREANMARIHIVGSPNWVNLTPVTYGGIDAENGTLDPATYQRVDLPAGLGSGTYEIEVGRIYNGNFLSRGTATFNLAVSGTGHNVTMSVQIADYTPVIDHYDPTYETRQGTYYTTEYTWVPNPTVYLGNDEDGHPVYGPNPQPQNWTGEYDENGYMIMGPGHREPYQAPHSYTYQVQVGTHPVYATDESGNIIYTVSYHNENRPVWVPAGHADPATSVTTTTPAFSGSYTIPAADASYSISVTTAANTAAFSLGLTSLSSSAVTNGDSINLRPIVSKKYDRWGNVTEISDPRSVYWKTTYTYNANNAVIQEVKPTVDGVAATTSIYYDRLGHQVAVKDARNNVNAQVYDTNGRMVQEIHADTGTVTNQFDSLGNKISTTDAMGNVTTYGYDRLGRLVLTTLGSVSVYNAANGALNFEGERSINLSYTWDELGRRTTETDGNGALTTYLFDLRGNIVKTTRPGNVSTSDAYDNLGRKTGEVDAGSSVATWSYDYFGQLTGRTDIGGATYYYSYDNARQLTHEYNTRGQNLYYSYDAAGQMTGINDAALGEVTSYTYDLAGNHIREKTSINGVVYQDNHLAYDELGRLRDVADARAHVTIDYDAVGNRTHITTHVIDDDTSHDQNRYFVYDSMNRQTRVDAVDAAGNIGQQGHEITYDKNGNRIQDKSWGNLVTSTTTQTIIGYDNDNYQAIYSAPSTRYSKTQGLSTDVYQYDSLNRLVSVVRDGTQVDTRLYDGDSRVVRSGAVNVAQAYVDKLNEGVAQDQRIGMDQRVNTYDAAGKLIHQKVLHSDGSDNYDTDYTNFDAAGNVLAYNTSVHGPQGYVNNFNTTILKYDGYKEGVTTGNSTKFLSGTTTQNYDVNGNLASITDSAQGNNNRSFVNDASGQVLYVNQANNVRRQLIVNGEVLGSFGVGVDRVNPTNVNDPHSNPNFAQLADFNNFGYQRVTAAYPNAAPGSYTVKTGDTLQSIALSAFGDSSMWYRIAEANGLTSANDLRVGQTINIPNAVGGASNNVGTFKPYDPSAIKGDTTPTLPTPQASGGGGCGGIGGLLAIIVTVAVAFWAPQFVPALSGPTTFATAAGSAALGSAVGQMVGIATGAQDDFSLKNVALSALSAGFTEGVGAGIGDSVAKETGITALGTATKLAVGSALSQGVGVALGLQDKFSWTAVAATAAGGAVSHAVGGMLGDAFSGFGVVGQAIAQRAAAGLAGGLTTAVLRGGHISVQQVITDAFGNALGESIAGNSMGTDMTALPTGDFSRMGRQSDASDGISSVSSGLARGFAGNTFGGSFADVNGLQNSAQESFRLGEIDAQNEQASRDAMYGPPIGLDTTGLKPERGGQGVRLSENAVFEWAGNVDNGIKATGAAITDGPSFLDSINQALAAQTGRADGAYGSDTGWQITQVGGGNQRTPQVVTRPIGEAAAQLIADPWALLGPGLTGGYSDVESTLEKYNSKKTIDDIRARLGAGGRNVPDLETAIGSDGKTYVDYSGQLERFKIMENFEALRRQGIVELDSNWNVKSVASGREMFVKPTDIRFTQEWVSYKSSDKVNNLDTTGRTAQASPESIPAMDVVVMPDGRLTSLDNRRLAASQIYDADRVKVTIRGSSDPLTDDNVGRFTWRNYVPDTWGDAALIRVFKQGQDFRETYRLGSPLIPMVKNAPADSLYRLYQLPPQRRR